MKSSTSASISLRRMQHAIHHLSTGSAASSFQEREADALHGLPLFMDPARMTAPSKMRRLDMGGMGFERQLSRRRARGARYETQMGKVRRGCRILSSASQGGTTMRNDAWMAALAQEAARPKTNQPK